MNNLRPSDRIGGDHKRVPRQGKGAFHGFRIPGGSLDDRRQLCGTKCSQVQHSVFGCRYCRLDSRFGTTLFPLEIDPTLRRTFPRSTRAAGGGGALRLIATRCLTSRVLGDLSARFLGPEFTPAGRADDTVDHLAGVRRLEQKTAVALVGILRGALIGDRWRCLRHFCSMGIFRRTNQSCSAGRAGGASQQNGTSGYCTRLDSRCVCHVSLL